MRPLHRKLEQFVGPPLPRWVPLLIVLFVCAAGFVCYHWQLMHAKTFGMLGLLVAPAVLIVRYLAGKSRAGRGPRL